MSSFSPSCSRSCAPATRLAPSTWTSGPCSPPPSSRLRLRSSTWRGSPPSSRLKAPIRGGLPACATSSMRPMPARRRGLLAALLCGLALLAPACGGGDEETKTTLAGAEMVPADVPLFASVDTNLESEQWQAAQALLDEFPGKERFLNELKEELADDEVDFERDVRPVLGPEIGVAWLDIDDDNTFVGLMHPKDQAKLNALLEKGDDPLVHTDVEAWTVFGESEAVLERFRRGQASERLSENHAHRDAVETP